MPISRDVKGIWELDSGPAFEGFFKRLQRLKCLETGPSRPRDRLKSVYLFVYLFFSQGLFESVRCDYKGNIKKKHLQKRGLRTVETSKWTDFGSLPNSGFLGRWHSPQIATAAPPAPRVHSSNWESFSEQCTTQHHT